MVMLDLAARAARRLNPETAHNLTIKGLRTSGIGLRIPPRFPRLETYLPKAKLTLPNPIGLAAGFDKNAEVSREMLSLGFGFVECGTVTPEPQPGNDKPRLFRLTEDRAVINRMGFNNEGLDPFVARLTRHQTRRGPVGANVGANKASEDKIADYVKGLGAVLPIADYVTINISSPNTPGLRGLQDPDALEALLGRCGEAVSGQSHQTPVFLKLAPDLDPAAIDDVCRVLDSHGSWLAGLIVSNTTLERPDTLISPQKSEAGGLSGAPLLALSTQVLAAFHERIGDRFDLIGAGGISTVEHVLEKVRAGARAVQLYSALVYEGPSLAKRLCRQLDRAMVQGNVSSLEELADVAR